MTERVEDLVTLEVRLSKEVERKRSQVGTEQLKSGVEFKDESQGASIVCVPLAPLCWLCTLCHIYRHPMSRL